MVGTQKPAVKCFEWCTDVKSAESGEKDARAGVRRVQSGEKGANEPPAEMSQPNVLLYLFTPKFLKLLFYC